jgi:hypothetical protein
MGDTLQDAINALRSAGLESEAKAVEELRARQSATMDAYHARQRASYANGFKDGSDTPPERMTAPDVLISKLANLRAIATERHVPEVDLATIDLAIEHLRYFSVAPSHRLSDARMDGIYNAWRDMGDDVSYGDLMRMVEAEIQGGK